MIAGCYYFACRRNDLPAAPATRRRPGRRMTAYPAARRPLFMNPIQIAAAARQPSARAVAMQMHLHICAPRISAADQAAIGATVAEAAVIRSAGASSISSPRRPALQKIVGWPAALASITSGIRCRCPSGEIPPAT